MTSKPVVLIVHPVAKEAVAWAERLTDAGLEVVVIDRLVAAVTAMRKQAFAAMLTVVPRSSFAIAESYLRDDEGLPPCVLLSDGALPLHVRASGVCALPATTSADVVVAAVMRLARPPERTDADLRHRILPMKPAATVAKWSLWMGFAVA